MEYLIKPWAHQLEAIERAKITKNFALFMEIGTGKTLTLVNILRHKYVENGRIMKTLILAPVVVLENWKREIRQNSKIHSKDVIVLTGKGIGRRSLFELEWGKRDSFIVVTNYESLLMKDLYDRLLAWKPECLVLDESHKCKDISSRRTKLCIKLSETAKHRYLLSGTPVLNSPLDLFSQFRILDGGDTFGTNFYQFRARFFFNKNESFANSKKYFPDWRIRDGSLTTLSKLISKKSMSVKKEHCLDLPPYIRETYRVELSEEQEKAYSEMKKHLITFVKENPSTAQIALTKALRLMQITSGFIKLENGTEVAYKNTHKEKALKDLLEMITPTNKVLIWAVFKNNYETIRDVCKQLKIDFVELHGEVKASDRQPSVDAFNNNKSIRVLIGHPGSGGIGVNLTAASYSIFYSRDFSLEHDLQAEGRNYRGGSDVHKKITRIDLVCKDTIDELVLDALSKKEQIGEALLKQILE